MQQQNWKSLKSPVARDMTRYGELAAWASTTTLSALFRIAVPFHKPTATFPPQFRDWREIIVFFLWHGFHTLVLVIDTSRISPPACTTGLGLSRLAPNRVKLPPHTSFFFHFFGIWRNSNIPPNLTIFIQLLSTLCITTNPLQIFRFYHDSLPPS